MIPRTFVRAIAPQCHRCTCRCGVSFQSKHLSTSAPRQVSHARRAPSTPSPKRGPDVLTPEAARRKREAKVEEDDAPHHMRWLRITDAYNRKQISVTPHQSHAFLNKFVQLCAKTTTRTGAVNSTALQELVQEYALTERDLMFLVMLLLRDRQSDKNRHWGKRLIFSLSAAGFDEASIRLMHHSLNSSMQNPNVLKSAEVATARGQLQKIARAGKNVRAMVLEGKIAYRLNDQDYAIKLWWQSIDAAVAASKERAVFKPTRKLMPYEIPFEATDLTELSAPWIELVEAHYDRTMVLGTKNERVELEEAIRIGVEQDDPIAFYYSATYYNSDRDENGSYSRYTSHWLYAMTKAAASGLPKAAYELAVYYNESGWKYLDDEPPDHVKPTPFDSYPVPAIQNITSFTSRVSRFLNLTPVPEANAEDSIFHSAAFPSTPKDRAKLAFYWLDIAKSYYYAPAFLYSARFHLQDTLWHAAYTPKAALTLDKARYAYENKEAYASAVFEGNLNTTPESATSDVPTEDPPNPYRSDDLARKDLLEVFRARAAVQMRQKIFAAAANRKRSTHSTREFPRNDAEFDDTNWVVNTGEGAELTKFFVFSEVFDTWAGETEGLYAEACEILERRGWDLFDEKGALIFKAGLKEAVPKTRISGFVGVT